MPLDGGNQASKCHIAQAAVARGMQQKYSAHGLSIEQIHMNVRGLSRGE